MLTATELYPVASGLDVIPWVEAVISLGIGVFEMFDDFIDKPCQWMTINGRVNGFVPLTHTSGHKMHAGICVVLGFVALNGVPGAWLRDWNWCSSSGASRS